MPLFTRHPLLLQAAFSELKRRAREQAFLLVGTPGSVGERDVHGRRFLYRQFYDSEGKKTAAYIGPAGDSDAEMRARHVREDIDRTVALVRETRLLTRQGYTRVDARTGAILSALANHHLFRAGAVLVGSHAYGALLNDLGVGAATYFTQDVDIARGAPLEFALAPAESFERMLADSTVVLHPVPNLDRKAPPTSYKAPGPDPLRVDLLVPAVGREIATRAVPELRAHATALPYFAYLLRDPIDAVVLARGGVVPVKVPRPEALAWHKMLASQLRGETREKRGKDVHQAAVLFAVLAEDAPDALEAAFDALPRGGKSRTRVAAKQVRTELRTDGHSRAVEVIDAFL
jgi:hypothetical protein